MQKIKKFCSELEQILNQCKLKIKRFEFRLEAASPERLAASRRDSKHDRISKLELL